jgi:hypothetical protein
MKIYVTVETFKGVIDDVCVFETKKQAKRKEQRWLKALKVNDDATREQLSFNCTEFQIHECNLKIN